MLTKKRNPILLLTLFFSLLIFIFLAGRYLFNLPIFAPPLPLPPTIDLAACTPTPQIVLDSDWQFKTDPDDVGLSEGWQTAVFDDSQWQSLAPGLPWELHGIIYDGVAWYRTTLTLPEWDRVYLGFGQVDDEADLWINDQLAGSWDISLGDRPVVVNLIDYAAPGSEVTLAFRVLDYEFYGGIKQPVRLGATPAAAVEPPQAAIMLAEAQPDWPLPSWSRGGPFAWTMTGAPQAVNKALLSSGTAVAPWATAPTTEAWLYDPQSQQIAPITDPTFSLVDGMLPIPRTEWAAFGVTANSTLFHDLTDDAVRWQIELANDGDAPQSLRLLVAARPLAVNFDWASVWAAGLQGDQRVWLNGQPYLVARTDPDQAGVGSLTDVMTAAAAGNAPAADATDCLPDGDAAALLVYDLPLAAGETAVFHFAFPDTFGTAFPEIAGVDIEQRLAETAEFWHGATNQARFDLPDGRISQARQASMGYLLLALDPKGPHPGPLAHDAVWVRDAAYIGLALLQMGYSDIVASFIPTFVEAQDENGRIPPIIGENAPWDDDEWDSQGQFIFLAYRYYQYTGDRDALVEWYPSLRQAAQFLVDLRAEYSEDATGPRQGILPPSKSVEDIGPPDWHHYWDNWWAIVGLEKGALVAQELGFPDDQAWMLAEAEDLREATLASIVELKGENPAQIPSAVESLTGSSNARGTVPVLWPVSILPEEEDLVERSFARYYEDWQAPSEGGFRHLGGHYWPYGGLELAHAYLRLGRTDLLHQVLAWTLNNETLPGTYAWAEQVNPANNSFSGGDMPHAWAAADMITLIRKMVMTERDDTLLLFGGAGEWWFAAEHQIRVENAPTEFGILSLHTESNLIQDGLEWRGTVMLTLSGAEPPGGFYWQLPVLPTAVSGPDGTEIRNGQLYIPPAGGIIELTFE
jgi:hypothetical protein